jgi:hypothetical protein
MDVGVISVIDGYQWILGVGHKIDFTIVVCVIMMCVKCADKVILIGMMMFTALGVHPIHQVFYKKMYLCHLYI